jgi:hypothetical protein
MGLRDRIEENARRLGESGRRIASEASAQGVDGSFRNLREIAGGDDDQPPSLEGFLLTLIRAVRKDEQEEALGARDVYVTSRKRRRRLGLMSFGTGPLIGVANQLADLYCEAAIVCDVATLHGLQLSDEQLAGHMLVLWGIVETPTEAQKVIEGEPPLAGILAGKLRDRVGEHLPEKLTKRAAIKALWDARRALEDARKASPSGAVRSVVLTGFHTKKVIKKAEAQLGVAAS